MESRRQAAGWDADKKRRGRRMGSVYFWVDRGE
jgi:hypothetical protein